MKRTILCFALCLIPLSLLGQVLELTRDETFRSRLIPMDDDLSIAVWSRLATNPSVERRYQLETRAITDDGSALGPIFTLGSPASESRFDAARSGDHILVAWLHQIPFSIRGHVLSSAGEPTGNTFEILRPGTSPSSHLAVAGSTSGFTVAWSTRNGHLYGQRFDLSGHPVGARLTLFEPAGNDPLVSNPIVDLAPAGDMTVAAFIINSESFPTNRGTLYFRQIPSAGPPGPLTEIANQQISLGAQIAPAPSNRFVVTWIEIRRASPRAIKWQLIDADGHRQGPIHTAVETDSPIFETRLSSRGNQAVIAWIEAQRVQALPFGLAGESFGPAFAISPLDGSTERSVDVAWVGPGIVQTTYYASLDGSTPLANGSLPALFTQRLSFRCQRSLTNACLQEDRFTVRVLRDTEDGPRPARATVLTPDTGGFWFFSEDNLEVLVKVLDGRLQNGHFWVLFGSMSNLPYTVVVTDTETGISRHFENPAGTLASQAITTAFADDGEPPARDDIPLPATDSGCFESDSPQLCLTNDRFQITAAWSDPRSGLSGLGVGRLISRNSGAFWFFEEKNLELIVKVLDGTLSNGHYWVFVGSLTDVEVELQVQDLFTGESWTHRKPAFTLQSHADTFALPADPPLY